MDQLNPDVRLALERAARGVDHVEDKRAESTDGKGGVNNPDGPAESTTAQAVATSNPFPEQPTSTQRGNNVNGGDTRSSNVASSLSTATATSTAKDAAETASDKSSSSSGGGSGGIGTGAIVGIVVGVVGGLLLIGGITFFILRKRRRSKDLSGGYDGTDATGTFMVDKETQGRATDSPNSPYTDENQTQNIPIESSTRDLPPHVGVPRTSTGGSHDERALSSRAETPQGVSSNVAHLVEDGMTAEEIRRLEEEERQLDDEIERAARR